MLNNGILTLSSNLSSSCWNINTITKSENVFESLVLEGVLININKTSLISDTSIDKLFLRLTGRVDNTGLEILLKGFTGINISESDNFFSNFISMNLDHFPSKMNINTSLSAFIKSNIISIWELINFFIWSPELDSSILGSSSLELILSHKVLIVQGIEVSSFALVWQLGGVDEHVTIGMVPSMIIISLNSLLIINLVNKYVILSSVLFKLF